MAEKRIREDLQTVNSENIIQPSENITETNKYDSVLQRLEELEAQNRELKIQVAKAGGDISKTVENSKRHYGYEGKKGESARKPDELFKARYNLLVIDRQEKVVVDYKTIGQFRNIRNANTGKWINEHLVTFTFQDGTTSEMDILDYLNQRFQYEDYIRDEDIKVWSDGKKTYTFRTEKFGTFTVPEKLING